MSTSIPSVLSPSAQLGRYFSVVGGVSTLVAALVPLALLASGAPGHEPSLALASHRLREIGLADLGVLSVIIVAVGLILHPLQFPITQLMEGYWGALPAARRAMTRSVGRHYRRRSALLTTSAKATKEVERLNRRLGEMRMLRSRHHPMSGKVRGLVAWERELVLQRIAHLVDEQQTQQRLGRYPVSVNDVMPTRLGNVLRRHEREAGAAFGLDAIVVVPYLAQVADKTLRDYHDDARSSLDLAVRMTLVWTATTVAGVLLLWRYDVWLIVPLLTSVLSYLSYVGSIAAAAQYGVALSVLVALGRGDLYTRLHVRFPETSESELLQNEQLMAQLNGERAALDYVSS